MEHRKKHSKKHHEHQELPKSKFGTKNDVNDDNEKANFASNLDEMIRKEALELGASEEDRSKSST